MSMTLEEKTICDKRRAELAADENYQMMVGDIKSTVANIRVTQEERIRESNRNHEKADGSATRNADEARRQMKTSDEHKEFVDTMVGRLREIEDMWVDHLKGCIQKHPVYNRFLKNVSGCGPALAGDLLSEFKVENVYYIGQLFKYAGIVGSTKRVKGQKADYNVYLKKRLLGVLPGSFLKARSPYAVYYYEYRIRMIQRWMNASEEEKKNLTINHQHMMANRFMVQRFVKDYYMAFRRIMDIPEIRPYEEEKLGIIHSGNTWTDVNRLIDMSPTELKEYKVQTKAKIVELKNQLDQLIASSGIPRAASAEETDENTEE